jgi:aminoglycoside phosphotransferase (APT) family kinase protein
MSDDYIDKPKDIRQGEEIDLKKVGAFLRDSIPGLAGELEIKQFPSGFSNLTYLVTSGDKEMILRRPPFGTKAKSAHDMGREFRMLKALKPVFPYCPEAILYSEDESVMGCPFYVMERLKGIILRKDLPRGMNLSASQARMLSENLIDIQLDLHSIDYHAIGLDSYGKPEGYVKRQIEGWSERYRKARTPDVPDFEQVMAWLAEKMPPDSSKPGIIHNDYKFDNVVLDKDDPLKIVGVLDWEMATIGDPLMDLGSSLAYWVEKNDSPNMLMIRLMPTNIDGMMTREEIVQRYSERSGIKIKNFDYYYIFGLFRLAVIAQQIYYRFYNGQTKDERFGMLKFAVQILDETAKAVIEKSKL